MTFQTLSLSFNLPARPGRARAFLRLFLDALIEGRRRKAAAEIAKYLEMHPEYLERVRDRGADSLSGASNTLAG